MRSVPEWSSDNHDAKVPDRVKLRIWRRDANADGYCICHISGNVIRPGDDFELEHKTPLSLGGTHSEGNMAFALTVFHRRKSAAEAAVRAETDAQAISHRGLGAVQETGLQGRTKEQKRAARDRRTADAGKLALPPRRGLYADAPRQAPLLLEHRKG